jgi:hypothetical protein
MSNFKRKRSLDVIAADIHKIERADIFAIGALLAEARDSEPGDYGNWLKWLKQQEFSFGYTTALNYLKAHDLKVKYPIVGDLRVPATVIYWLAESDEPNLPVIIKAPVKIDKVEIGKNKKVLSVLDCNRVIDAHRKKHVKPLIDDSPEEDRPDDEQDTAPQPQPVKLSPPETKETSHEQATAAAAVNNDIGIDSKAEASRKQAVIDDLANERNKLKIALEGRDREIARLEEEIGKLKIEPRLSLNKLIDALVQQLKKVSREKQELVIEELREKLALNKTMVEAA